MFLSRRSFLASAAISSACLSADRGEAPSEIRRYSDPATEFDILKLTETAHQSWLPANYSRSVSRRGSALLYSSDRSGAVQAWRMDLKSGQSHQLSEASNLVPDSVTMTPDERSFCYLDGRSLFQGSLSNGRAREVHRAAEGFEFGSGFSLSEDGLHGALVEHKSGVSRLQLISMRGGSTQTIAESSDSISDPMPRPRRAGMLYRKGDDELWLVNFDGAQNRKLKLAPGGLGPYFWSPDGRTVLYLNIPGDRKKLNNIRECVPDTNDDQFVSNTSQFAAFNKNADASVFAGASASKASPYVLLLVRSVRRELTLCEHRASDPRKVAPIFSPNSQRVYFQSDKDGKMAIYSIHVERLVEDTEVTEPRP